MMVSWGVNTLISDSGVMRYRMIAERWEVNTVKHPSFWKFDKGLVLEEFDEQFHVQAYITCDSAWYYDQLRIWELRGNVKMALLGKAYLGYDPHCFLLAFKLLHPCRTAWRRNFHITLRSRP